MSTPRVALPGSERWKVPQATHVEKTDPSASVEIIIVLKPRARITDEVLRRHASLSAAERQQARETDYVPYLHATEEGVDAIRRFATEYGLNVTHVDPKRRVVELVGSVAQMEAAFSTSLHTYRLGEHQFRGREQAIFVPEDLLEHVESVMGLDNRPVAQPHAVMLDAAAAAAAYYPNQLAALYGFPTGDGTGQTVAIIELGGNYGVADLQTYFAAANTPMPHVQTVSVSPGVPVPYGSDNRSDSEVMLDIEVVGAIAPAATIMVYFALNTDDAFYQALSQAVHAASTTAVSISWGLAESTWSGQTMDSWETLAGQAALLDVSIFASAGDHGAADQMPSQDGRQHVDFPGSTPHIVSCGGTHIDTSGSTITNETVWNNNNGQATGGGISTHFPLPPWQTGITAVQGGPVLTFRGVPDVSGNADPNSGIQVRTDGQDNVSGGTSAVSPLWSALTALIAQQIGYKPGFFVPRLYENRAACKPILDGNNTANGVQGFSAKPGWNACTGLGSPTPTTWAVLSTKPPTLMVAFQANDPSHFLYVSGQSKATFAHPAVGYSDIAMGSSPAAAVFNNTLYLAFQANDLSHSLFVTASTDGTNFLSPARGYPGITIGSAPAMAVFNNRLYIAFRANDSSHSLFVTSSADGTNFVSPAQGYPGIRIGSAPAMAVFNNKLYIAFQANDSSHSLFVTSSADGTNFVSPAQGYPGIRIGSTPAMAVFNNKLYIAFQANDPSHALFITSSSDGVNFTTPAIGYSGILIGSAPAMAVYDNNLYVAFRANDLINSLFVTSSSDGLHFTTPATGYGTGIQIGSAPALVAVTALAVL